MPCISSRVLPVAAMSSLNSLWASPAGRAFDKPPDELPIDTTFTEREEPAPF